MMNVNEISFPNMGIDLHNVPEGFPVFGFEIKLYAICVVLGMFAGGTLAAYLAKRGGWDKEKIWDFDGGIHPPEMKTQSNGTPLSELRRQQV